MGYIFRWVPPLVYLAIVEVTNDQMIAFLSITIYMVLATFVLLFVNFKKGEDEATRDLGTSSYERQREREKNQGFLLIVLASFLPIFSNRVVPFPPPVVCNSTDSTAKAAEMMDKSGVKKSHSGSRGSGSLLEFHPHLSTDKMTVDSDSVVPATDSRNSV